MKRTLTTSLMLVLVLSALALGPGQLTPTAGAQVSARRGAPLQTLDSVFTDYELSDLDSETLAKQSGASRRVTLRLDGITRELELVANNLRAPSYRATVTTDAGTFEQPAGPVSTYKGTIAGEAGTDVRLLIEGDLVMGYVRTAADCLFVEPASLYDPGMPSGRLVVYRDGNIRPEHRGECGTRGLATHADAIVGAAKTAGLGFRRVVEIATDADFEFVRANGSSTNAVIEGIINQVDGIYRGDVSIEFRITHQHTFATSNDPYKAAIGSKLLRQFKKEWNRAGGAGSGVVRDVAHLFTGRDLIGASLGEASVGVVCNDPANAYALSQASATGTLVKTVAHQLGHNLGVAAHDDDRGVDDCNGDGPLMCTGVQGSGANVFSQASINDIVAHVAAHGSCLDTVFDPGPDITPRRVRGDFDGDGKADLSIKGDSVWLIDLAADGFGVWNVEVAGFGFGNAVAVPTDYDGDAKDDISLKGNDGVWVIDFASNGFAGTDVAFAGYGDSRAIPVPADYDGDGKADLSVKSLAGDWFIDYASNGFGSWDVMLSGYGNETAHPVPADYDGDGKADLSVKGDSAFWLIDYASNGFGAWDAEFFPYGEANAHPVPADYDGDGKADLSVKTDIGEWFIDWSVDGFGPATLDDSFAGYGDSRAVPVPADYDGDGKADLSVKSLAGDWFIDYASDGFGSWDAMFSGYGSLPPVIPGN
jgi:hypothetical protein